MRKNRHTARRRFVPTILLAGILATASYAFMASNTVPPSNTGQGTQQISGYTASSITYALDTSSGTANVTGVSFTLTPDNSGAAPSVVKARLASTGAYQTCSLASSTWSCTFPSTTAASAATLDIAASQ